MYNIALREFLIMDSIFNELANKFSKEYVENLKFEYNEIKKVFFEEDETKIGIHSGRFCELVSSLLCYKELTQIEDLNKINFNNNINRLINKSNKTTDQEISCIIIPNVLKSIYSIRNKKKVAHFKKINPTLIDIKFINIALDWILSQIFILYTSLKNPDLINYLEQVSSEDFKKVEIFENGDMLFYENITWNEKIIFFLSNFYNKKRVIRDEIYIKFNEKTSSYLSSNINALKKQKLIHENENGIKLSRKGLQKLKEIRKKLK